MHIAVIMGGWSAEREVSLSSGKAVAEALLANGHAVTTIDATPDLARQLKQAVPDVVFNALHGRYGEDGTVQGLLEILKLPYTHSGVLASSLAMDKPMSKVHFEAAGIPCAEGMIVSKEAMMAEEPMSRPYVIKPLNEGSSVGVTIVGEGDTCSFAEDDWPFGDEVLVERYIPGREIQVAVLDGKALGAIEIRPRSGFYDYSAKYTAGLAEHMMPAPLDADAYEEVLDYAERAHRVLGCRGITRSDFRYNDTGDGEKAFYILELNTQPGMTALSLAPEIAAHAGISFSELVERLVQEARHGG